MLVINEQFVIRAPASNFNLEILNCIQKIFSATLELTRLGMQEQEQEQEQQLTQRTRDCPEEGIMMVVV